MSPLTPPRSAPPMHRLPVSVSVIQAALLALGVMILVFIWGHYEVQDRRARDETLAARAAEHQNLAVIVAENLIQMTDRARALGASVLQVPEAEAQRRELSRLLAGDPVFNRLALFSPDGQLLFASHEDMADGLDAQRMQQVRDRGASFGNQPFLATLADASASGPARVPSWRLPFLLPMTAANSLDLRDILLIELDIGYLASLYQHLDLGRSGFIQLLDASGRERMRASSSGVLFATDALVPGLPDDAPPRGTMVSLLGTQVHQSVYRRVPEHGFSVRISQSRSEILGPVSRTMDRMRWLNLTMSAAILGGLVWLLLMLRGQKRSLRALQASEGRNRRLIARLRQEHERSRHEAATDHLSGLFNRRECIEVATRLLAEQRVRRGLFTVLFIELARFKSINDTLGHRIGDLLLQAVAGRIRRSLADGDHAARFGGDEFVVLLAGERSEQEVDQWTATLTERLSATYELDGIELNTSPSIGVAICPRDAQDIDALLRCADAAMYSAKQAGRGQYRYYDPSLNPTNFEAFHLEQSFAEALRKREFVLHFQPQMRLSAARVIGYEALVRWQHPDFGLVYPDRFIAVAEDSGFIIPLGLEVLRLACEQLQAWRGEGLETCVAINVSALQLSRPGFADQVLAALAEHDLSCASLEIEITETAILQRDGPALDILRKLSAAGVGISLDDFGQGYAGFAHLQSLPLTRLKIDRSLIAQISNRHDDSLIVSSTIALAHRLGLQVVAEGVETREQLVYLRLAGCDIAQGYHFARPLVAADVVGFEARFSNYDTRIPS